jgi:hypothetical protein
MAILELVKMQEIRFRQEENFSAIFVIRRHDKQNFETILNADQTESTESEQLSLQTSPIEPVQSEGDDSTDGESDDRKSE